ncbi:hypothetical protein KAI04_03800 [Candidatus Pacearchaeota archaeon]|nr:hypothetical protein [Candidatus Pacearchaeota archaeon]
MSDNYKNLNLDIVCGFINGEGCFTNNKGNPLMTISASIIDKKLLLQIQKILNLGKVYTETNIYNTRKCGMCSLKIHGDKQCQKLIKLIDGKIFGVKRIDFENFKHLVNIKYKVKEDIHGRKFTKEFCSFYRNIQPRQNKKKQIIKFNGNILYYKKIKIDNGIPISESLEGLNEDGTINF